MDRTMLPMPPRKNGNFSVSPPTSLTLPSRPQLRVERGGLYERRPLTPEQWLEKGLQNLAIRCKAQKANGDGAYASRAVADIAHGLRKPTRVIARLIAGVIDGDGPVEFGEELSALFATFTLQYAAKRGRIRQDNSDRAA